MRKLFSPCAAWPEIDGGGPLEEILALPFSFPPSFYLERESRAQSGRGRGGGKGGSRNAHAQKARRIHIGTVSTPRNKCKAIIPNFMVWALSPDMK